MEMVFAIPRGSHHNKFQGFLSNLIYFLSGEEIARNHGIVAVFGPSSGRPTLAGPVVGTATPQASVHGPGPGPEVGRSEGDRRVYGWI